MARENGSASGTLPPRARSRALILERKGHGVPVAALALDERLALGLPAIGGAEEDEKTVTETAEEAAE